MTHVNTKSLLHATLHTVRALQPHTLFLSLPSTAGHLLLGLHAVAVDADHGLAQTLAALGENLGVLVVRRRPDDGLCALDRVAGLEDAAADKDTVAAELHHERGISRGGNTAGGEVDNGQTAQLGGLLEKRGVDLELPREGAETKNTLGLENGLSLGDVLGDLLNVGDGLDDITGAGLALGADHGGTLSNAAEGLAQVAAAADKGGLEVVLLDVVLLVGGSENLALVNVIDAEGLEDLAFDKVADTGLGHDGDGDGVLNFPDHGRIRHAGDTAVLTDICGDTLQGHDGAGAGLLGDAGLLRVHNVHDDAALQHLGEAGLDGKGALGIAIGLGSVVIGHFD